MFESVTIEGYRCFKKLQVDGLKRVNLIVGKNNSGKTSLLEAVRILASEDPWWEILDSLRRRGAYSRSPVSFGIKYLFHGISFPRNSMFLIRGKQKVKPRVYYTHTVAALTFSKPKKTLTPKDILEFDTHSRSGPARRLYIANWSPEIGVLEDDEALSKSAFVIQKNGYFKPNRGSIHIDDESNWLDFSTSDYSVLARRWRDIFDRGEEILVNDAVRIIDDRIENVSFLPAIANEDDDPVDTDYILLKLKGRQSRVGLSVVGEGVKLALAMACTLVHQRQSCLFIDEIDTGLHHSVLADMWRMVIKTAEANDVQVFATTHSRDCIDALAEALYQDESLRDKVSLQRVEADKEETVAYDGDGIIATGRYDLEVRG